MDKYITEMKKPHHNIYGLNPFTYKCISVLFVSLWLLLFVDVHLRHLSAQNQVFIWIVALLIVAIILFVNKKDDVTSITPYSRTDEFHFCGLYNLKNSNLKGCTDVLPRDEEVKYMHTILEEIIFPQEDVKQALCITGPSGYGKSIILDFFKREYANAYNIYDFSGNYHEFTGYMTALFGTHIDTAISRLLYKGKIVFVLDQFERFFFLSEQEQQKIQEIIKFMCKKNTGIIVSLREEYLADFLTRFDMNNLLSTNEKSTSVPCGILKEMFSVLEKKNDVATTLLFRLNKTQSWENCYIKNNETIHLDPYNPENDEQMGTTLLYCRNQNKICTQINGKKTNESILESHCTRLFGDKDGKAFFYKHINDPLIEQQIIFHMAEFNQKVLLYPEEKLQAFLEKDNNELLEHYFDQQLASCSNYFHASRILYLLSQARIRQLSLKTTHLENYLFPKLFESKGHEQFMTVIRQLEKIQLIRKNTEGTDSEYEIAHDFIAVAYLNYCSTNMDRNVKGALDLFIAEYMDDRRNVSFLEKIRLRKKVYEERFFRNISCFAALLMAITYLWQRFVFNPWTTIWTDFNPYGSYVPAFPVFITLLSGVYIFYMYDKTVKYYRDEKMRTVKMLYVLFAFLAFMAVFAYPHFLFFDGIGLAIATLNIALLLNQGYRQTCRNELLAYGAKSVMIGLVFAFAHIFYFSFNRQFDDVLIFSEFVMFTTLLAYGFFVHMTQDFLYARMSDSSSEKV